jgi:hypothetical protein
MSLFALTFPNSLFIALHWNKVFSILLFNFCVF